jgi:hypothetical protein
MASRGKSGAGVGGRRTTINPPDFTVVSSLSLGYRDITRFHKIMISHDDQVSPVLPIDDRRHFFFGVSWECPI